MYEIVIPVIAGILIGLAIALLSFRLASKEQIKNAKQQGMNLIYKEIVTKRKYKDYQYSDEVKRVMDKVHLSQILE
ncbi:hypothetical protein [Leucothrix pacifica]|uniref:Uncharacterized protein n=1 Tax=Leucothrix pacifica TaxID=1247513 RepID=A0A317CUT2_9GAMM|nr:hypothetical protein [Leucothrix pacifica]PWR00083.1 hypothetical protein DKW60_02795 [Leucothrix pacifica]